MPFWACGENCAVKCRVALWQSRRPRLMSVPFFWRQSPQRMPCLRLDLQRDFWELLREKLYIEELYCSVPRRRRREVSSQQTMLYQHGIIESVLRANTWFSFFDWNSDLENQALVIKLFFFLFKKLKKTLYTAKVFKKRVIFVDWGHIYGPKGVFWGSTSRSPCCVFLALSWNTNESTDRLSRAIN